MPRKSPNPKKSSFNSEAQKRLKKLPSSDVFFKQLKFLLFIFLLSLIYIFNTHSVNSKRISVLKLQEDIKYLRGEHTSLKAQNVDLFRHSVLLEDVKEIDLDYSNEPLKIINYDKSKL